MWIHRNSWTNVTHNILRHWSHCLGNYSVHSQYGLCVLTIRSVRDLKLPMDTQSFILEKVMILLTSHLISIWIYT